MAAFGITENGLIVERKHCEAKLRENQALAKEAASQVEYWTRQLDAVSTLQSRLMVERWRNADSRKETPCPSLDVQPDPVSARETSNS